MRLFLYYITHSVFNTIRKVLKTWVAFMLVVILFGFVVGTVTSAIEKRSKKAEAPETTVEEVVETEEDDEESEGTKKIKAFMHENDISKAQVVDLAISVIFLMVLAMDVVNAEKSGKIFKPADIPMLFASPLKPQSVLLFRLICSLGVTLIASVFMISYIPMLTTTFKFGVWASVTMVIDYALIFIFSTLVQVVFYTIASRFKGGAGKMKPFLAGFYGVVALGFVAYTAIGKQELVKSLFSYFASPETHWVPFWGWLRAICYYAITGETVKSVVYLGIFLVASIILIAVIWNMKADFYEDAMFAAESKASEIEAAQNASKGAVATRKKDRSDSLDREGFRFGSGANVYFFKAVFNRFRFAKLKIFSTTMIVYLLAGGVAAWLARRYTGGDGFFIPAAVLGAISFYRTLGDPIREDTTREFFILIPAKPYAKIFYSLLGSTCVTAIDLAIPMIVAACILGSNPLNVILWFVFILSIGLFASVVGTLISLSLPKDQAQTIAIVVQMIFLYFGITPAAAAIVIGVLTGHTMIAIGIGTAFNLLIAFLVSLLLPRFVGRK